MSSVIIPSWTAIRTYRPGEMVSYGGLFYVSLSEQANNLPTDTAYWNTFSSAGSVPDASTTVKGKASFAAADFNVTAGDVTLDYTNAQKATTSIPGLLSATDWTTFNAKHPALTLTSAVQTRVLGTTYTNSSATHGILVMATVRCAATSPDGVATAQAKQDTSTPATTVASGIVGIQDGLLAEDVTVQLVFWVPPGTSQKYQIDKVETNGTVTLGSWFELVL